MAASPLSPAPLSASSSPSLALNKEKSNHTRLCRLLVDIGRQVFQDVFDKIHPSSTLTVVLWSPSVHANLKNLRARNILYQKQWDTLFPPSGAATSADFDITLLFLLLRNICNLVPPLTGWNNPPPTSDLSIAADIIRIKTFRNELYAHAVDTAIPDAQFQTLWNDIRATLLRLGGPRYEEPIQRLLYGTLDPENEHCLKVLLHKWEEEEDMKVDAFRQLAERMDERMDEKLSAQSKKLEDTIRKSRKEEVNQKAMMPIKGTFRVITAGGVVVAWAAGSGYLLRRYINDPKSLLVLVNGAIIPSMFATEAFVRRILEGSFKILVEIHSLDALNAIHKSYKRGKIKENLEKVLVNDELRALAPEDAEDVVIELDIAAEDYTRTRDYLLEASLKPYAGTYKFQTSVDEETISEHLHDIKVCLKDKKAQTPPIVYPPGRIEWKVAKNVLAHATSFTLENGIMTLEMSNPINTIVHALIDSSANLNVEDIKGITLLILAIKVRRYDLAILLVKSGADVNMCFEDRKTPLMHAINTNEEELVDVLIKAGADVNTNIESMTPLICAIETKRKAMVDLLIQAGAIVMKSDHLNTLHYAIEMGSEKLVSMLIDAGANVNKRDELGNPPLIYAIKAKNTNLVKTFIKAGASVNKRDSRNKTPLIHAIETRDHKLVEVLLKADADPNESPGWITPLIYAIETGDHKLVEVLLKAGADPNESFVLITPLICAIEKGDHKLVEVLLKAGALPNESSSGKTPLIYAIEKRSEVIGSMLLKAGAKMYIKDPKEQLSKEFKKAKGRRYTDARRAVSKEMPKIEYNSNRSNPNIWIIMIIISLFFYYFTTLQIVTMLIAMIISIFILRCIQRT